MKNQTETTYSKVLNYLAFESKYRDNDELLVARFWYDEMIKLGVDMNEAVKPRATMEYFVKGKLTKYDTITRLRRKVQEKYKALRGDSYTERKDKKTEIVKEEIKEITSFKDFITTI